MREKITFVKYEIIQRFGRICGDSITAFLTWKKTGRVYRSTWSTNLTFSGKVHELENRHPSSVIEKILTSQPRSQGSSRFKRVYKKSVLHT